MSENYLAALDIGTNSFHLIIARVNDDATFKVVDRNREVFRIASDLSNGSRIINEEEMKRAINTIKEFKKTAEKYGTEIKAVATSAVREAVNQDQFIERVHKATGVKIDVIDGSEEAKYIFLGASRALHFNDLDIFCFDIGGGSTELIYRRNGEIIFSESVKLGAVRLSRMFFPDYILSQDRINRCEEYVRQIFKENKNLRFDLKADLNVGTSGTIQSAVLLSHLVYNNLTLGKLNGYKISFDDFLNVYSEVMKRKDPEERIRVKGMEAKRADILPAGLLILKNIFELFNIGSLVYSDFALREGLIISQM